jgi:hypothetical protein
MSLHIARFVDRLRSAQERGQREVIMPVNEAQGLHADITRLLLLAEQKVDRNTQEPDTIKVEMQGGAFRSGS